MSLNTLSNFVNWPLFIFSTLIICLRCYAPNICRWILEKYKPTSSSIKQMKDEMNEIVRELETISQQDQFALYSKKERKYKELKQRLKDERTEYETKQTEMISRVRLIVNLFALVLMIYLAVTGQRHNAVPLFSYPFFSFPFVLWILALNACLSTLTDVYQRYRTKTDNKKSS